MLYIPELSQDHSVNSVNATWSKDPGICNNSGIWKNPLVSRDTATWPEALDICNGSFASFDYYDGAPNNTKNDLLRHLNGSSGWLYGLEGISTGMVLCKIVYDLSLKILD